MSHEKTRKKALTKGNTENTERKRRDNGKHKGVIMPVPAASVELPGDYADFLKQVKQRVKTERLKAASSANVVQILMYWDIGHDILRKQEQAGWGAKVIDRLAYDLKEAFPEMNGFSARNLKYMRKFTEEWPVREIVQRTVAQIPFWKNSRSRNYGFGMLSKQSQMAGAKTFWLCR